jgi:diguanylate cyclase (GGDEF)-like protein
VSLRSKMLALSTIPVVVLVFAVAYAVSAQRTAARTNRDVDRTTSVRRELAEIHDDLAVAESSVRGFVLTGQERLQEEYEQAVAELERNLVDLDARLLEELQRTRLERLRELVAELIATQEGVLRLGRQQGQEAQERMETYFLHGQTITDALQGLTEQMQLTAARLMSDRIEARESAFSRSFLIQVLAMPIAIFSAMILMAIFTGGIVGRVTRMRQNAVRLEQGQPLERPDTSKDEVGSLSRALVRTGNHLSELQEELRRHATVDDLTGLANRRGFFALGEHELLVAARTRSSVALLFLDVDGLKVVNDELGHVVGDLLLKEAAEVIRETTRGADIAGRLGGDEFCVLLMGDPELDPARVVQRMHDTLAAHNARPGRTYQVSLSMGLSALPPGRSVTLEELIDAADERMYEDKRARQQAPQTVRSI